MFTGLVTAVGTVLSATPSAPGRDATLTIAAPDAFLEGATLGASISCAGCCLTAIALEADRFTVEASAATLSLTTLGAWRPGTRVNLERSLRVGDELGGHLVSGHVDAAAPLLEAAAERGSLRLRIALPPVLAPLVARKGSVAVDGVSLTVNEVSADDFTVNIIPHTAAATTLGLIHPGDVVNLEVDVLARYVARLAAIGHGAGPAPLAAP
jgi:riboflavin synthase